MFLSLSSTLVEKSHYVLPLYIILLLLLVSKGILRGYWTDSMHTFTQYPVLV